MAESNDHLPQPPHWVPSGKKEQWFNYWRKIYLDAEDTDREVRNNQLMAERMANGSSTGSEVEAD